MKKIFLRYMIEQDIYTFKELSKLTGIKERTLEKHVNNPSMFRIFEIKMLNDVLRFSEEDLLMLIKGE